MRAPTPREIIVDNFAGGGGASTGIALALGRSVDVAINHDPKAIEMHTANHPMTTHYCESVWDVDPRTVHPDHPVGLLWLSPDCKHFSKAKGGKPVEKKIRGLAWVAVRWAAIRQPRVLILENVEEFVTWGPLVAGPDGAMRPCPKRKGREFNAFCNALRRLGYVVEHKELRACDWGAPTIRRRLFLIARRDGKPIVWPAPTHGDPKSEEVKAGKLLPWRTAADCIDWSLPTRSIFERKKPLADATYQRIAKGMMKYVVNTADPFIVKFRFDSAGCSIHSPLPTITAGSYTKRPAGAGHALGLCVPTLIQTGYGERQGQAPRVPGLGKPLGTVVAGGAKHALVTAFLAKHYTGVVGASLSDPAPTVTSVDHNSLVTSSLIKLRGGGNIGQPADEPLRTISAGGQHFAEVRALLVKHHGEAVACTPDGVVVSVQGEPYVIADIGLRMLAPRELFRAQGFPEDYIIGDDATQGLHLTQEAQVRMCGNSVSPLVAAALVSANAADLAISGHRAFHETTDLEGIAA
jgi:DNA (cytosine-5)-methyltransferase 1